MPDLGSTRAAKKQLRGRKATAGHHLGVLCTFATQVCKCVLMGLVVVLRPSRGASTVRPQYVAVQQEVLLIPAPLPAPKRWRARRVSRASRCPA
jgi:hypothetical protein